MAKKIFIDFEMAKVDRKYTEIAKKCREEIIQVGAVMLDEDDNEISEYMRYVRPTYVTFISNRISHLTGISMDMLLDKSPFEEVCKSLCEWMLSRGDDISVYAWGTSDLIQFTTEIELKIGKLDESMNKIVAAWHDLQKDYDEIVGSKDNVSLDNAIANCGLEFEGKRHDGLMDARNTARVYIEIQDPEKIKAEFEKRQSYYCSEETYNCSLASLVDFSKLKIQ